MRWDLSSLCVRVSTVLLRRKGLALTIFALLLALAGYRFFNLSMDTSVASLVSDASPRLAAMGKLIGFNPGARVMLVEFSTGEPGRVEEMTSMAMELRRSMAPFLHTAQSSFGADPASLLSLLPALFDADMEARVSAMTTSRAMADRLTFLKGQLAGPLAFAPKALWQGDPLGLTALITERLPGANLAGLALPSGASGTGDLPVSEDGKRVLLILLPRVDMNDVYGARDFMEALEGHLSAMLAVHPAVRALPAGGLRFTSENARTIERDLALTVTLSLAFIAFIYVFTVRSWGALWLFLTPVAAVIFSGAAMSFIWPVTAGLALGFGAAVLGLAEDYAVLTHFALRKNPHRKAQAIGALARPMVFSAALCMAGFGVLMLSNIPALRQLGFFAACSLLAGLGMAIFVLPCLPWMDKPRLGGAETDATPLSDAPEGNAGNVFSLNPRPLPTFLLSALLLTACLWGVARLPFDTSFQDLGAGSRIMREELQELRARWLRGTEPGVWASSGPTFDAALACSAVLARDLRQEKPEERASLQSRVFSLSDLVPPRETRFANLERWQLFLAREGGRLTGEFFASARESGFGTKAFAPFLSWFSGPQSADSMELLHRAGFSELLWWMTRERDGSWHILTLSQDGLSAPQELENNSVPLSSAALTNALNQAFDRERRLLPLMCAICFLLLTLCFRRPALIMLASLPPLLGLAVILAWLHLSGRALNLAGAAALPLVLGLGADYGIVMLHELASHMSLAAFRSILVSGLTTLSGLGVLILAEHPVLHTLGGITFFGLCAEMAAVLLLVPLLCKPEGDRRTNRQRKRTA